MAVDPFASNDVRVRRRRNEVPSLICYESVELFNHSRTLVQISEGAAVCLWQWRNGVRCRSHVGVEVPGNPNAILASGLHRVMVHCWRDVFHRNTEGASEYAVAGSGSRSRCRGARAVSCGHGG